LLCQLEAVHVIVRQLDERLKFIAEKARPGVRRESTEGD
jgi:hypothetical protein